MDLNLSKSVMDLMYLGRLFHNVGAIFSKALSPNVLDFTRISERRFFWLWTKIATRMILLNKFTEISRGIATKAFQNKMDMPVNCCYHPNQQFKTVIHCSRQLGKPFITLVDWQLDQEKFLRLSRETVNEGLM